MTHCNRLSVLLASCSLLAPAFAQEYLDGAPANAPRGLEARRMPPPLVPIHTAADDQGLAYGVWAAGTAYKASFHDGATFVPYLGADYPATQSLRWRTVSARIGELELVEGGAQGLSHAGYRAQYDLGGIVEAYDVRANGLEQTFVIGRRPAATGDLIIRGAITTALQTAPQAGVHGKLLFCDAAGTPILEYGAATAIDGSGRTQPMTTSVEGDTITLRLDGSWLANAAYPLVVDPLIGVVYSVSGAEIVQMDLARDTILQTGNIWRSASRYASATDADVWLRRVDDDGNGDAIVYSDITASWSSFDTSIGIHQAAQCGLLAFTRHFASSDLRQLRCHKHHRGDMTLQTAYFAIGVGSNQAWRPDVATDLSPFGAPNLLVVFQREDASPFAETPTSGVYGVSIDMTGTGSAGASFAIADGAFEDNERPQVGKVQGGAAQVWTVAYQIIGNGAMSPHVDWDVEMRRVDSNGTVSNPKVIGQANGFHELAPRVAGYNDVQMLAYTESDVATVGARPTGDNGMNLLTRVYEWNGAIFVQPQVGWYHSTNPDPRVVLTGVDVDRNTMSHYAMTFRSTFTGNAYLRILGYRSHYLNGATLATAAAGQTTISGGVAFDDDAELFLLGYGLNDGAGNFSHVDRYAYPYQAAPVHAGLGCSPGQLSWTGSQLIGDEGCEIRLANLAPGALATVLVGTAPYSALLTGLPPVHPGCWLLVPNTGAGSLATMPIGFGPSVSYQLDLPEWLPAMTLYFQGVHFNAANTEVFTTDRLEVSLVK